MPMNVQGDLGSSWTPEPTVSKQRRRPHRPKDDPFHVAPPGFEALAPGTLIRSREVDVAFLGRIPQQVAAWQLLYRTSDLNGVPEATVTTVLLPHGVQGEVPLLAYQCAIDAVSDRCFPSYAFQRGASALGSVPQFELLVVAGILRRGWAVSVSDHEGLGGYFGAPREPGYRVLDGVRAALAFAPLGLSPQTPVGMMGYSGGGMATSWAAEMAPSYAAELNVVGATMGSPVGDPAQAFIKLNATRHAGLPALVVSGLRHIYPGLGRVVAEHANFEGLRRLKLLEQLTTIQAIAKFAGDDFDDYLDAPLADVLAMPEVLEVFDDLRLAEHMPTCPLLVVQATHDQIIDVLDVDSQVERYVEGGAHVAYVRDRLSEHVLLQPIATPAMLDWLEDRLAGKPAPAGTRTVWSMALSPRSWNGYLTMGAAALRTLLGRPHRASR